MALYKYHYIELDTKRSPRISLQNIVAGETGNRLIITVTNNGETVDMSEKEDDEFIYRVALRIDSDLGTRRQDSDDPDGGITFIEENTGDHGKINILLSADSYTVGKNRCRLEIYSKRSDEDDTLICSAEWTFDAAGNPTGENTGTAYPLMAYYEQLAKSWAVGGTGRRDGENTDNAMYFKTLAEQAVRGGIIDPTFLTWLTAHMSEFLTAVGGVADEWLEDNITNPSNPPLDASLSLANAAADAKVTGDIVAAKKISLADGYIKTVAENASVDLSVLTDTTTVCAVVTCTAGEIFHIYGTPINVSTKRPFMFVTSENVCYFRSIQTEKFAEEVVAPITGKLVLNLSKSADYAVYRNKVELSLWTQATLQGLIGIVPQNYIRELATGTSETNKTYTLDTALSGATANNMTTDTYAVTGGELLIASGIVPASRSYRLALFYDADGNFLGYHDRIDGQKIYVCEPIVCPPKCAYVRFAHSTSNTTRVYRTYTDVSKRKRVTREGDLIKVSDGTYTLWMSKHGNNNLMDLQYIRMGETNLHTTGTDWQGPYVVSAKSNADGDAIAQGQTYTGGNHAYAYDGGSGSATARTLSFKVVADGIELEDGGDLEWSDYVEISWVNRVQAWNTKKSDGTGREVLEENPVWTFKPHGIVEVQNTITALEDITVSTYYGMQMTAAWLSKGLFIPTATRDIDSVANIYNGFGADFDGSVVKGYGTNLDITMEIDTSFDLGTGACIGSMKQTHINASKAYLRTVNNTDFDEDNVFAYRGRYTFRYPS